MNDEASTKEGLGSLLLLDKEILLLCHQTNSTTSRFSYFHYANNSDNQVKGETDGRAKPLWGLARTAEREGVLGCMDW